MKVLVAMSGGVDSSVAAALLVEAGHDVTGVTMKLWGGPSDTGCCSVADVDDARRVARQLDIQHLVFNFGDDFMERVVEPYVQAHAAGSTPNPCIECNRHIKFDRLVRRGRALGFDSIATGHHARVVTAPDGTRRIARGADAAKDQSYVLHMLGPDVLDRVSLPVGTMTKAAVRDHAARLGLRTAGKPDSQDVCFITATGGRRAFLADRIALHPAVLVDTEGADVGQVPAVELVTPGQRRGLGLAGGADARYAVSVDVGSRVVTVGSAADLLEAGFVLGDLAWSGPVPSPGAAMMAQTSAHGRAHPVILDAPVQGGRASLRWVGDPRHLVAPGQSVALYEAPAGDVVVGGGIVAALAG